MILLLKRFLKISECVIATQRTFRAHFMLCGAFNKFPDFFVQAFTIVVDTWKFTTLLLYILWDNWPNFMISASNEQLQEQLKYTLLKPDCHSWWISKADIFITASYQTGLDTRSMTRKSIKEPIKGEEGRVRAEARALLNRSSRLNWNRFEKSCYKSIKLVFVVLERTITQRLPRHLFTPEVKTASTVTVTRKKQEVHFFEVGDLAQKQNISPNQIYSDCKRN